MKTATRTREGIKGLAILRRMKKEKDWRGGGGTRSDFEIKEAGGAAAKKTRQGNSNQNREWNVLKVMPWEWSEPLVQPEGKSNGEADVQNCSGRTEALLTQLRYHLYAGPTAFILTE